MTPQELLANVPLFESLTDDDVDALAARLETVEYEQGSTIFSAHSITNRPIVTCSNHGASANRLACDMH